VPDLEYAMSDPDSGVRNNAMRALAIIAKYGYDHPAARIKVSPDPFIKLLNSLDWTDRDKAGFALVQLMQTRDPVLLAELRQRALPALIEMARWKTPGHADMFCVILARIAGMPDKEIQSNLQRGEKEKIIAAALKTKATGKNVR
jgi:HEAT repeat protein